MGEVRKKHTMPDNTPDEFEQLTADAVKNFLDLDNKPGRSNIAIIEELGWEIGTNALPYHEGFIGLVREAVMIDRQKMVEESVVYDEILTNKS